MYTIQTVHTKREAGLLSTQMNLFLLNHSTGTMHKVNNAEQNVFFGTLSLLTDYAPLER
jgi:hypothetical protein